MFQYTLYLTLAPLAAALVLAIAGYAWMQDDSSIARALAWYLFAVFGLLVSNIFELVSGTANGAEFYTHVEYLFIPILPVLWVRMALIYVGRHHWAGPSRIWVIAIFPVVTILLAWSNQEHQLIWAEHSYRQISADWGVFSVQRYGPWFWGLGLYSYSLMVAGAVMIILQALRSPRVFRFQTYTMIAGAMLPLVFNLIYIFRLIPGFTKDYSPLTLALAGAAFLFGILRHRLLRLSPVARAVLIESMLDPMLVLDDEQHVIDLNPAAERFLGASTEACLGMPFSRVWPEAADISPPAPDATRPLGWSGAQHLARRVPPTITMPDPADPNGAGARSYELHMSHLPGRRRNEGWLVVLHDLTMRRQIEEALETSNRALAAAYHELAEKSDALAESNAALTQANTALHALNEALEERVTARTESLRQRNVELEAVTSISTSLRQVTTKAELLNLLVNETVKTLGFHSGAALLHEDDGLHVTAVCRRPAELLDRVYPPANDVLWQALHSEQPTRLDSPAAPLSAAPVLSDLAGDAPAGIAASMQAAGRSLGLLVFFFDPAQMPSHDWPLATLADIGANATQRVHVLETLEQLVRDRTRDLSSLYDVTTTTNEYQDIDSLLERILEKALEVLHGRVGLVHLYVEENDPRYTLTGQARLPLAALRLEASLGLDPAPVATPAERRSGIIGREQPGPWSEVYQRGAIVVLPDVAAPAPNNLAPEHQAPPDLVNLLRARGAAAYVGVPLHAKGRILGVMSVFGESLASFSAEDIALLAAIADHLGGAVENALLRQKAEQAAVVEERQRLARDLHDSVTQSLYSLVLFGQAGRDALDENALREAEEPQAVLASDSVIRARDLLNRLSETAQQALKELRLLIFELRPLALYKEGLVGALRNRLETVEQRAGMHALLLADHAGALPPEVEAGLYGIAQEALNNVLKHAQASQVTVRFEVWPERVELEISDNGCGFLVSPEQPRGGIGLSSMRERAAALGGALAVRSEIGRGTNIWVSLQREEPDDGNQGSQWS